MATALVFAFASCNNNEPSSGSGEKKSTIKWEFNSAQGILTAMGSGAMKDYENPGDFEYYDKRDYINEIILPEGLTNIGKNAFCGMSHVRDLELPNGVTKIGDNAFNGCESLETINFPGTIKSIGEDAFNGCHSLVEADLSKTSISLVAKRAFYGCHHMLTAILPQTIESISESAFNGCSELASVRHDNTNTTTTDEFSPAVRRASMTEDFSLPSLKLKTIGDSAFYKCTKLPYVSFPSCLTTIGDFAFENCSSIASVNLAATNISYVGKHAFKQCTNLETVYWSSKITEVKESTFYGCTKLNKVDKFENGIVKTIERYAFYRCEAMRYFFFPSTVKTVGECAFYNCLKIVNIDLPNATTIGKRAFMYCKNVNTITLSDNLKRIEDETFYYIQNPDYALTYIVIPAKVEFIGYDAFGCCAYVTEVKCKNPTPPTLSSGAFGGLASNHKLYVPSGSLSTYQSNSQWKQFFSVSNMSEY